MMLKPQAQQRYLEDFKGAGTQAGAERCHVWMDTVYSNRISTADR